MRTGTKIIFLTVAGVFFVFGMIVGFNSLAEWVLVWNYEGYQKETFVVSGTRDEASVDGEGSPSYYVLGHCKNNQYEFSVSKSRYDQFSDLLMKETIVTVYRNPSMISVAFQGESLNVIFEEDWRSFNEVKHSAQSTLMMTLLALSGGSVILLLMKAISVRLSPKI